MRLRLTPETADEIYDALLDRLARPEFRPRALFERFRLEVLATTESPLDPLHAHARLAAEGWGGPGGRVITTFRPDDVVDLEWDGWADRVAALGELTGEDTGGYPGYLAALERRREAFRRAGATATDHGHPTARTLRLDPAEAAELYRRGLRGEATPADAEAFRAHMLLEFARMSVEDGLVMQLHPGSVRNHNRWLHTTHGRDTGGDIPSATDYVHHLAPLLDAFGNDPRLRLVLFTLDETTFTRELAPLAGATPPSSSVRRGGSSTVPRACAGSGRPSPRRPGSPTPPGSSTTPGRSARSRSGTRSPAGWTPPSSPGSSSRTGCPWTRPPRPSPTCPTTCPDGCSVSTVPGVTTCREPRDEQMTTTITGADVHDVRFPTAAAGDGSDAINRGDYSAAYVELRTSTGAVGAGFTFTNGRGNEIVCAAIRALLPQVVGRTVEEIAANQVGFWRSLSADVQLRWLGPEKGVIHMATGAVVNAVWDLRARLAGLPMWQYLAEQDTADLVAAIDFRHIADALTPEEATELLERGRTGYAERLVALRRDGYPAYTTSVGWLGYPDAKVRSLTRQAVDAGWRAVKMKVGGPIADDVRRAALIREEAGPDVLLMMDANQVWNVDEAIANMAQLVAFDPYWIEEPTHADDVLGHARIAAAVAPVRVATGEVAANRVIFKQLLQAGAIGICQVDACRTGGVNEVLAVLLMAAKYGVPVCPHAGGVGLCEYVQHLAVFDALRISGSTDGRMIEYVDHLHEHFVDPVTVVDGRYRLPTAPGYSVTLRPSSIAEFSFPDGPAWR